MGTVTAFINSKTAVNSAVACALLILAFRIFILNNVKFFKEHSGKYQLFYQVARLPSQFYNWIDYVSSSPVLLNQSPYGSKMTDPQMYSGR